MILITRNAKIQSFFPCILTKSVLQVDVCRLPIAWSAEIIFHAFSWLVFSRVKDFLAIPFLPKRLHHPKKPSNHPNEHIVTVQDSDLRKLKHASLLPKAIWSPRVMDSFADVILFGQLFFCVFVFVDCLLPKKTFEKPQVHGFCCALSQTPDRLYRDFWQRDRSSNHISSGQISPRPHTA